MRLCPANAADAQNLVNFLWLGLVNEPDAPTFPDLSQWCATSGVEMAFCALRRSFLTMALCLLLGSLAYARDDGFAEPLRATSFAMAGDAVAQNVEMTFSADPQLNWFLLRGPHRLVLDVASTRFLFEPGSLGPNRMIESVRFGDVGEGRSRIILAMKKPFAVELVDDAKDGAHRLQISVKASTAEDFDSTLMDQKLSTGSTAVATADSEKQRFTIVLDPGHGGIDGGAQGVGGTAEKSVTLTFAEELKAKLDKLGKFETILTRADDRFIRLDERVKFARTKQADLFVSIHADTIRYKGVRGATVYTVSDEASDAEAAELADRENLADHVAGMEFEEENPDVADILVELVRRETHVFSISFARSLVQKLSSVTGMIKNPHRHAGFRVLRAPDVPSVLLELGYLSNPKDEAQILNPEWRNATADSVVTAIEAFAGARISNNR